MNGNKASFINYVGTRQNRAYLLLSIPIGIVSFIALRYLYPIASFYSDSFTWLGAALTLQPVTFRPVGYSKLLFFFKFLSESDFAVVAAQYYCNLLVNLFLFFSFTWFFPFRKAYKIILYILLIVNPFYALYSNYISSDAFFNCLAVLWFILLVWTLKRPSWALIILQVVLLAALFALRYNALFFPAIAAIALVLSKQSILKKITGILAGFAVIVAIVLYTTDQTKKFTGTKIFSAFSGWQLANNAMHIVSHKKVDTTNITDSEVKGLLAYNVHFLDTTTLFVAPNTASADYMWDPHSPLKYYMKAYPKKQNPYFGTWNALGPLYSKFGKTIILQKPWDYLWYFVLPNTQAYFLERLEIYGTYMENRDTMPPIVTKFYNYKSSKTPEHHPAVYTIVFKPMQYLFSIVNVLLIILGFYYFTSKQYKENPPLFSKTLFCFGALFVANFLFIVLLAPTVLRYHIFILTLGFPILLYLIQQITKPIAWSVKETAIEE